MTIVFAQDPTGPDPFVHEVFQIGALFCPDDLSTVRHQFACYVTPRDIEAVDPGYLRRQSIQSREELRDRIDYWESPRTVWGHFQSLAEKGGSSLESARIVCFDAALDAAFLRKSLSSAGIDAGDLTRNIGGLVQATLDIATFTAYLGEEKEVMETVRDAGPYQRDEVCKAVFDAHDVSCKRLSDAKCRAEATRQSYRSILMDLSSSQTNSSQSYGRNNSKNSPTVRRR